MKVRSPLQKLLLALCVLAVVSAQLFGVGRDFLCLCSGAPVAMASDHCHGPHGAKCHTDAAKDGAAHNEQDSGSREDHRVVKQDVQSRPVEATPQVIAPQVLLAILPLVEILFSSQETKVPASYSVDFGKSPPFGVTVARTIVLLI